MKKRVLSWLLILLTLVTLMLPAPFGIVREAEAATSPAKVTQEVVVQRIKNLQNAFSGKYFTTTQKSCGNSSCSKCNAGNVLKKAWVKNAIGLVPSSFSMTHYYYGGGLTNGWSCCGFANYAGWYIFAQKASNKVKFKQLTTGKFNYTTMSKAKPGDIIRLGSAAKKGKSTHSAIVVSVSSTGVKVLDCNFKHYNYVYTHTIGYTQYSKYKYVTISRATNYDTTTPAQPVTATVTLNANGGGVSKTSIKVTVGQAYGTLPVPAWAGYTFLGWFDDSNGGNLVTESTIVSKKVNHTLYAHWKWALNYSYDPDVAMGKAYNLLKTAQSKKYKCATYVSSVLRAGGLTNVSKSGAGDLIDYLNKGSNFGAAIGTVITNPKASQLHPGDVLCVVCTKGGKADFSNGHGKGSGKYYGLHVLIVSKVNVSANTVKYYAANSYVYGNKTLNLSTYKVKCSKCGNSNSAKLIAFVFNDAVKGQH